jgi:hypothetical protein
LAQKIGYEGAHVDGGAGNWPRGAEKIGGFD